MRKSFRITGIAVLIMLFVGIHSTKAQFAIGGRYSAIQKGYWHDVFATQGAEYADQLGTIYGAYWFRLKEKRMEFLPEAGYFHSLNKNIGIGLPNTLRGFYLQLNTDIYFLDFGSDCNCPTFSKQNDVLKRGLFLEVSPGYEFRYLDIDYVDVNKRATKTFKQNTLKVYGGLGFDLGLSDFFTVTPTIGLSYLPGTAWDGVEEFLNADISVIDKSSRNRDLVMNAGVRILMRPDYTRKR